MGKFSDLFPQSTIALPLDPGLADYIKRENEKEKINADQLAAEVEYRARNPVAPPSNPLQS